MEDDQLVELRSAAIGGRLARSRSAATKRTSSSLSRTAWAWPAVMDTTASTMMAKKPMARARAISAMGFS
ncbi:MAG: hypothetical protein JRG96_20295 [Deltaproteobacteria bacterium]|nr:hypothetical protein [Deltaproteobacteria bacterium]